MPTLALSEQYHRAGSPVRQEAHCRRSVVSLRSSAVNTIQGYEAMHMIRKGQIRWLPKGDIAGQVRFVNCAFGLAA